MLAYLFLSKVATLTQAINSQTFPYINICLTGIKAAFAGISVSICERWFVNRKPEEYFLTAHHVRFTDACTIAKALQSFLQQKQLDLRKLICQGYDCAATFAGKIGGVHKRIQKFTAHAIYLHQQFLSQVTTHFNSGSCINEGDKAFFCGIEWHPNVIGISELKIMKPSDTRWLSHERYVKVICKELPPLKQTFSQLYESSGDAEPNGIYSVLAIVNGQLLLSEFLSPLALLTLFMLKNIADFRKLPFMLKSKYGHLNSIREIMPVGVLQLRQHIEFRNWAWKNN